MPQLKLAQLFEYRNVTPSALAKGNLVYFKYSSPKGVHDKSPLIYVIDKSFDKVFGYNIHYDMNELQDLVDGVEDKVNSFLENNFFNKHPEKRQEFQKQRIEFDKTMIEKKELLEFNRKFIKKDLEVFNNPGLSDDTFRSYLFKRMNNVSRLVWKLT